MRDYEHPDITRTLRTGYPYRPDFGRMCPRCDGDMGEIAFEVEGKQICSECFKEWVIENVRLDPETTAHNLGIEMERVRC